MFTECREIIMKGEHKGKLCGDVNKRCRHKVKICLCGKQFMRDTSYMRHVVSCRQVPKIKPVIKIRGLSSDSNILNDLVTEVQGLKTLITQQPTVNNITHVYQPIVNNIYMISDVGAFKILCDKMGVNEATEFLCALANKPKTMVLFEKVYLDCEPDDYPIANANGKDFYYYDGDSNIIYDEGGCLISKLGDRLIKNTFLEAADPLLTRFVKQNEGEHDGDDDDYDRFRALQTAACSVKADRSFIRELSLKTYHPGHRLISAK